MSEVAEAVRTALLPRRLERKDAGNATEKDHKELTAELKRIQDGINVFAEEAKKRHGDLSTETKTAVDKLLAEQASGLARIAELEKKLARRTEEDDGPTTKTIGQYVVADEGVQAMMAMGSGKQRVALERKAITGLTAGAGGVLVPEDRLAVVLELPQRRLTVRDLITPGSTTSSSLQYVRVTGYTNAAAIVAETAAKPESALTWAEVITAIATIAHWVKASKQILADAPQLQTFIDGQLRYGLKLKEEAQLLKGSGIGGNLNGIYTQATAYVEPIALGRVANRIDILRLAMLQGELAEFPPTGIVLHPSDWAAIELSIGSDLRYLFANPQALAGPTLWGLPVVTTQALAITEFLVGAFKLGAQIFDREQIVVLVSTEDQDNFIKNMVTILCEERLGLAVYRPEAFIKGAL
jgi:HK97 family phage major capsid protein